MFFRKTRVALTLMTCLAGAGSAFAWGGLDLSLIGPTGEAVDPGIIQLEDGHGLVLYRVFADSNGVYHVGSDLADYGSILVRIEGVDDYKVLDQDVFELPQIERDHLQLSELAGVPLRVNWRVDEGLVVPQNLEELSSLAEANAMPAGKPARRSGLEKTAADDCMASTPLVIGGPPVAGSTIGGVDGCGGGIPGCTLFCSDPERGQWFSFVGNGQRLSVGTCSTGTLSSGDDTDIRVFFGPCDALTCAADDGQDGSCGGGGIDSDLAQVTICSEDGVQYYVLVSSFTTSAETDFTITVEEVVVDCPCPSAGDPPPANDECTGATPMEVGVPVRVNNLNATLEANVVALDACTTQSIDSPTIWLSVVGDGTTYDLDLTDWIPSTYPDLDVVVTCADCEDVTCVADLQGDGGRWATQTGALYNILIWPDSSSVDSVCFSAIVTSDGRPVDQVNDAVHCLPVGAACIKCLEGDAACVVQTELGADQMGANYMGDDTTCLVEEGGRFQEWRSTSPPLFMPDSPAPPFIDVIVVADDVPISNLEVSVQLTHTFTADLEITLVHFDTGTTVNLMFDECGSDNDLDATFSDFGENVDCTGTGPVTGFLSPAAMGTPAPNMLSAFNGESSLGVWQLFIHDDAGGDTGIFLGWQLKNVEIRPQVANICGPRNNGLGNGIDAQPGGSDNCNDCPGGNHD